MFKILIILWSATLLTACQFDSDDITPPVITLIGGDSIILDINTDPSGIVPYITLSSDSYTVSDNIPGVIEHEVPIINNDIGTVVEAIDLKVEGQYIIMYKVYDEAGNEATKERELIIKDITAPQLLITQMHPNAVANPYPDPADPTSILLPKALIFQHEDFLTETELTDIWYQVGGIPSLNPVEPLLSIIITPQPTFVDNATSGDLGFSFEYDGIYELTYTATDNNQNTTIVTRMIGVAEDTIAPEIITLPPLTHFPLGNVSEDGLTYTVSDQEKLDIKRLLTTQGVGVSDEFYPYYHFSSYLDEPETDITVTILEESPVFTANFIDQYLATSTPPGGVDIPMVVSDKSGNVSAIYKRKLIIIDQEAPILVKFPSIPLILEIDASLTSEQIQEKIVALSSDPDDQDNIVIFADNEVLDLPLLIESITDANGVDVLNTNNSLSFDSLSIQSPIHIVYTTTDGYNPPSALAENRTRVLVLQDTSSPTIDFNLGLLKDNFFSFLVSAIPGTTIDSEKQAMFDSGILQLQDNGTIDFNDIILTSIVLSTDNIACQATGATLDLYCPGKHIVRISAEDQSSNTLEYNQNISIYVYDQQSKNAFDEIINRDALDAAGNELISFNTGTWSDKDPSLIVSEIEAITKNTTFDSTALANGINYILNFKNQTFGDSNGLSHDVILDFVGTSGNYINFHVAENYDEMLTFARPQPLTVDFNKSTLETTYGSVTELISVKLEVGTYAELIKFKVSIDPYYNPDNTQHLVIPVFIKYQPPENPLIDSNPIFIPRNFEEKINIFYDKTIYNASIFMSQNTAGMYNLNEIAKDVNNGIQAHSIAAIEIDNRYDFGDEVLSEYILDSEGRIKKVYMEKIVENLRGVIENNYNFRNKLYIDPLATNTILDPALTSQTSPRKLKISIIVIDPDLEFDVVNFEPKYYSDSSLQIDYPLTVGFADGTCVAENNTYRTPRDYETFDLLCSIDGLYYVPKNITGSATSGEYAYTGLDIFIGYTDEQTDADGIITVTTGWCPLATPICTPESTDKNKLVLFEYPSDIYDTKIFVPSDIQVALPDWNTDASGSTNIGFALSTFSSGFVNRTEDITTGDFLSKFIFHKTIPNINYQSLLFTKTDAEQLTIATSLDLNNPIESPYTYAAGEEFSFTSAGFANKNIGLIGDNPSNLSAFDKHITSTITPIELSLNDMKYNDRIYTFDLNTQSNDFYNQNILKLNIWANSESNPGPNQSEYFLIEKRVNAGGDLITGIEKQSDTGTDPWLEDELGIAIWHVENEMGAPSVKKEGGTEVVFTTGFKLKPELTDPLTSTNTNEGAETGIVIKILDDFVVKICHINAGDDPSDDVYDGDCTPD